MHLCVHLPVCIIGSPYAVCSHVRFLNIDRFFRKIRQSYVHAVSPCSYVNYVRIRDALNRTRTAYSDGVTVLIRRPDTASVRDGLADNDIDFQQPVDTLSANWDSFGDSRSTLPSDRIIRLGNNNNNNNVHLSCAHQRPERSHDTY